MVTDSSSWTGYLQRVIDTIENWGGGGLEQRNAPGKQIGGSTTVYHLEKN